MDQDRTTVKPTLTRRVEMRCGSTNPKPPLSSHNSTLVEYNPLFSPLMIVLLISLGLSVVLAVALGQWAGFEPLTRFGLKSRRYAFNFTFVATFALQISYSIIIGLSALAIRLHYW